MPAASNPYNPCEIILLKALIAKTFNNSGPQELSNKIYFDLAEAINYAAKKSGNTENVNDEYLKKIIGNGVNLKFRLSKKNYILLTNYVNVNNENFNFNDFYTSLFNESIIIMYKDINWDNAQDRQDEVKEINAWALEKIRNHFAPIIPYSQPADRSLKGAYFIDEDYISIIEGKPKDAHKAIDFYTAKRDDDCQWFGILQKWDLIRTGYKSFRQAILNSFANNINSRLVGLVSGPGGSGKSTLLRRLAIDTVKEEFRTIWVSNINDFLANDFDTSFEATARYLIIIEDWYQLAMDDMVSKSFLQKINEFKNIRIVIGDRDITGKFYKRYLYGENILPLSSEDNLEVLRKLKALEPIWSNTIDKLMNHAANTSLYLLLFLFAHVETNKNEGDLKIDLNDVMADFREIIQSDLKKIYLLYPGIAKALFYWSNVYKVHKIKISDSAFWAIAYYYQQDLSRNLQLTGNTNIGQLVFKYIYFDKSDQSKVKNNGIELLNFNHDLLAEEGLAYALLEGFDAYDDNDKRNILNAVVHNNEHYSSSVLFDIFYRNERQIFHDDSEIKEFFFALFNKKNNQHHYLVNMLSFDFVSKEEKLSLINQATDFCNKNNWFWSYSPEWINSVFSKLERKDIFQFLFSKITNTHIWTSYRKILERRELYHLAIDLLTKFCNREKLYQMISYGIICNCLTITGDKRFAEIILKLYCDDEILDQSIAADIICTCLTLTHDKTSAEKILKVYCGEEKEAIELKVELICTCLTITGDKRYAEKILNFYCGGEKLEQNIVAGLTCTCLAITEDKNTAEKILELYCSGGKLDRNIPFDLICTCLTITGNKNSAEKILKIYFSAEKFDQPIASQIISTCLTITGDKISAEEILKIYFSAEKLDQAIAFDIVCSCLNVTGDKIAAERILNKFISGEKIVPEILSPATRIFYNNKDYEILIRDVLTKSVSLNQFKAIWNSINILHSINPENEELQKVVSQFFSHFFDKTKSHELLNAHSQLLKIPLFENRDWCAAVNYIDQNYRYLYRKFVFGYIIGQKEDIRKTESICRYFLENWQREVDFQKLKRIPYYQHIMLSFQHPALEKLAKEIAPKLYAYITENNIQFLKDNMKVLEDIVMNGIIKPWPIKEALTDEPI